MEKNLVGYRFSPTGEELINYYLKNKILGKSWLVDEAISEININNYDPNLLPSLSKIDSDDPVWYFFSPKEYIPGKKKVTKRTTSSGYWKATGVDRKIKDKGRNRRGGGGGEIGIKKTLVYYQGRVPNGVRTDWVMHEYHITCLPQNQRNYVICQVMYKGEDGDIPSGVNNNNSSEPSRSINTAPSQEESDYGDDGFDPNTFLSDYNIEPEPQPQTPINDEYWNGLLNYNGGNFEDVIPEPFMMIETNYNDHRPRKALSGIIDGCNSDDSEEAESISATSYQGTSNPGELQTSSSADSLISWKNQETRVITRRNVPRTVDASIAKTEKKKKRLFVMDQAVPKTNKNPKYVYLMKMIIGFILLVSLIGHIVLVLSTVKT